MIEKISLEMLKVDSVSVMKQTYTIVGGVEYPIGQPWNRAYRNSERGRQEVTNEVPSPYKEAIFSVWGDTPTIVEEVMSS